MAAQQTGEAQRTMESTSTRWRLRTDYVDVFVAADPRRVYDLVADLPRMGEWSPECERVEWEEGFTHAVPNATFVGHNGTGPGKRIKWSRHGRVLVADPGRELAFITDEGGRESTEWHYTLEPVEGGTRVTEAYVVRWIPLWARILDVPANRAKDLRHNMLRTLLELKHAAERADA